MQRSGTTGTISISGTVGTGTHSIEARWNGGAWTTIAASASGTFSGSLTNQPQGSGELEVRYVDQPWQMATVAPVGIGDVFVIAGQSNAMGPGTSNQANSGSWAGNFAKSYHWIKEADPTDTSSLGGVVDQVSNNSSASAGSVWPLVAGRFSTNNLGFPIAFVPCAGNGSAITQWQPSGSSTNRNSLYGSMVWRSKYAVGGCKAVLWWQGEYEAANGASAHWQNLTNLSANIQSDMGVKLMPAALQQLSGAYPNRATVNSNITNAWAMDANCLTGPDLTDIPNDDGVHLTSNAHLATAAERWWEAIKAAFYP